jgi:CHAD domain-containing protein
LRLAKTELGDLFVAENTRLRDAARGLSEFRDAAVVIQTFDDLVDKYRGDLGKRSLDSIRRGLLLHKARAERKAGMRAALQDICQVLRASARRTAKWPLESDGFTAIAPGLEQAFKRGRKAMSEARKHPSPQSFHEWRKRVKDHWYHVRLLEDLWADVMGGYQKSLKQLEDWLGSDHNLEVLRAKVTAQPEFFGAPEDIELLLQLMEKHEKYLRDCALEMGARIYVEGPRQFRKRMAGLWETWQG